MAEISTTTPTERVRQAILGARNALDQLLAANDQPGGVTPQLVDTLRAAVTPLLNHPAGPDGGLSDQQTVSRRDMEALSSNIEAIAKGAVRVGD